MSDEELVERLDTLISLISLAFHDQVSASLEAIRTDTVNRALLDGAENWIRSGVLQRAVIEITGASERTVQRRLTDLTSRQLLSSRGSGVAVEYRTRRL